MQHVPGRIFVSGPVDQALVQVESASLAGRDDEAESLLIEARHAAVLQSDNDAAARVGLCMAWVAVLADDDDGARWCLQNADEQLAGDDLDSRLRLSLARRLLERRSGSPLGAPEKPANLGSPTLRAMQELACADWELMRGDPGFSLDHAAQALALAGDSIVLGSLARLATARALGSMGSWQAARDAFLPGVEALAELGMRRLEGRACAWYALEIVSHLEGPSDGTPVSWLGRAMRTLGASATWRDKAVLRSGFQRFGRRIQDKTISSGFVSRYGALDERIAKLRGMFGAVASRSAHALSVAALASPAGHLEQEREGLLAIRAQALPVFAGVGQLTHELADLVGSTIANRERLRRLLEELSATDTLHEASALGPAAARLAARQLEADRVIVARAEGDNGLEELGRFETESTGVAFEQWREPARQALAAGDEEWPPEPVTTRCGEHVQGPVLVFPMRAEGIRGVLYADRLHRGVQFRDGDQQLGRLIADHLALALSRLVALEASQRAAHTLAVTLDTLNDGVIALDAAGNVTNFNSAAARLLRIEPESVLGKPLVGEPSLAPLATLLAGAQRLEGAIVKLPRGVFVVSSRPIEGDGRSSGVVATISELDRVQRIVHRATTGRARYSFRDILGESPALLEALRMAHHAASVDANVLITGASGTGKELFAQAIHNAGARASEPFVGVNCAAVPRDLLEAELFGYERGAFTGARAEGNPGKFELAGEGMILLDEIGDMPIEMQAKLLRVLQERVLVRLGGSAERVVHARVIATTHRNLDELVQADKFRLDLLYRLRVIHIQVPTLTDRGTDTILLARAFLVRFAEAQRKAVRELSDEVIEALMSHRWTGNVRELANVLEREVAFLPPDATVLERLQVPLSPVSEAPMPDSCPGSATIVPLAEVERRAFTEALRLCGGNVPRAARALGVSKVTFYARLKQWGLHPKDRVEF